MMDILSMEPEALLTPGEVAQVLRVDPKTVTRWCSNGKFTEGSEWIRLPGGHRRIRAGAVQRMYGTPGLRVATP